MGTDETRNNGNQELGDRFYKFALRIIKLVDFGNHLQALSF